MATAAVAVSGSDVSEIDYSELGVFAGCEYSRVPFADVDTEEKAALKLLNTNASKRDYPARLTEILAAWEAALFYRGFQFLLKDSRSGGWKIPGEGSGYGASMQEQLSLLPTNVYSAQGQILIATLTRAVPAVRFEAQDASNDAQITGAESAGKFVKVIERNNDLMMIQNDAARYLFNDGRFLYYTRYMLDGQRFGWKEEDQPDGIVPENQPPDAAETPQGSPEGAQLAAGLAQIAGVATPEPGAEPQGEEAEPQPVKRTPRGQEVRSAHGKLEVKLSPMSANEISEVDSLQYETEVSTSRGRGRYPWVAKDIKGGSSGISEGEIAKLARQNVKLGMQSSHVTSDSIADDVTIQMNWHRPCCFDNDKIPEQVRDSLRQKFPDGVCVVYAGETFCYARNESMDDCWALGQAFSGDGQNRNALGTSSLPVQKRINNWLDLLNDSFIRTVPKKWMHNKAFDVEAIRAQSNIPGDVGSYKPQPGIAASDLIFVEPAVTISASLPEFVKEYIGPIMQVVSGAYPALSGMEEGGNPTAQGKTIQRNQALGRLAPTWHSIQNAEAKAMLQAVRWGSKCRDGSVNEKIPGGEVIKLEVNNLKANILCFPEADEAFPENHAEKEEKWMGLIDGSGKNPQMQEMLFNAANLAEFQKVLGLTDLYIPQVASYDKQLGELELLTNNDPVPNPTIQEATDKAQGAIAQGVDPAHFDQAHQEAQQLPPEVSTVPVDPSDDHATERFACWKFVTSPEGRKLKRLSPQHFQNVMLHMNEHDEALAAKQAPPQEKPPSESINYKDLTPQGKVQLAAKGGIQENPADLEQKEVDDKAQKAAELEAKKKQPVGAVQ